ncbi:MAG: F0F1 ATP synthase subunit B [Candidatus Saccharibacteria bacterium]
MISLLNNFAAEAAAPKADTFTALGINWQMLIFQGIAFLVLVWILAKFVFPPLLKAVDARQTEIEASTKAAHEAQQMAAKAEKEITATLEKARKEAKEIVATAKDEATAAVSAAEAKAIDRAKKIVSSAHDQTEKDVIAAKKMLYNETIDLVALATEKVVGKVVTSSIDGKVVENAVKEAK